MVVTRVRLSFPSVAHHEMDPKIGSISPPSAKRYEILQTFDRPSVIARGSRLRLFSGEYIFAPIPNVRLSSDVIIASKIITEFSTSFVHISLDFVKFVLGWPFHVFMRNHEMIMVSFNHSVPVISIPKHCIVPLIVMLFSRSSGDAQARSSSAKICFGS